jgi:hypothetical protein
MPATADFDRMVGTVAGAIYSDVTHLFPHPPLMLVPAITFKVRKILEQVNDLSLLSTSQRAELAKDIRIAIVPMLFMYEVETEIIEKLSPTIESAAYRVLLNFYGDERSQKAS